MAEEAVGCARMPQQMIRVNKRTYLLVGQPRTSQAIWGVKQMYQVVSTASRNADTE